MNTNDAETRIARAKTSLLIDQPFFGQLSFRLGASPMPAGAGCETMATDGENLFYHAPFVCKQSARELVGVIAHEIMHCVLGHHTRRNGRDHKEWNIACDYAVNAILLSEGYVLPEGALFDPKYAGMSAEAIYAERQRQAQQQQQQQQSQSGNGQPSPSNGGSAGPAGEQSAPGEVWDAPSPTGNAAATAGELQTVQQQWDVAVMQAAQAAKAAGKLPGSLSEVIAEIRAPQIDWRDALRRYMTASVRDDYSWRKPNVRHLGNGDYLPALSTESLGEIVVAVDTSGSIGNAQLATFAAEINAICENAPPRALHVVYCDSDVAHADEYTREDMPITLTRHGGGGTAFAPVWDWIEDNAISPTCVVYLTDLDCRRERFGEEPSYPVLWVSTAKRTAPFGEVVNLN